MLKKLIAHLKSNWLDILSVFVLVICGIKLVCQVPQFLDLIPTDDAHYMQYGFKFPKKIYSNFGPIYSAWFKVLKVLFKEPILIYYISFMVISVLVPASLFLFLRSLKMNIILAFLLSFFFLCSELNLCFNFSPKISLFALIFIFIALYLVSFLQKPVLILILSLPFVFLCSYIRPEYFLSFEILAIVTICWIVFKEKMKINKLEWSILGGFTFFMLAIGFIIGLPLGDDARTTITFQQHFAWNYQQWYDLPNANWFNYKATTTKYFGEANSITEFFRANPSWFFKHVFYNIGQYFLLIYNKIGAVFFPKQLLGLPVWFGWLLLIVGIITTIAKIGVKKYIPQVLFFIKNNSTLFFIIVIMTIPSFITSTLINAREHYLVLQLPLFFFMLSALFFPLKGLKGIEKNTKLIAYSSLVMFILAFVFVPKLTKYSFSNIWEPYEKQYCLNAIKKIRTFNIQEKVLLVESEGGLDIYSSKNYKSTMGFFKDKPFYQYIDSMKINMIYVSKIMAEDEKFYKDTQWNDFEKNYSTKGFDKIIVTENGNDSYFYVKNELLKK
jgi:hypothetical protein